MKTALVIGLGRFGKYTAMKLADLGVEVMAVDKDEEDVNGVIDYVTSGIVGDCTDEEFLRSLGVNDFDLCIVAISENFLASLEVTFYLKELGAKRIVSRANRDTQEKFLLRNGADAVVYPERQMGEWTAVRYTVDGILDYIPLGDGLALVETNVPVRWVGKSLMELDIRRKYDLNIIVIKHNGSSDPTPDPDYVFNLGDTIRVVGTDEGLKRIFTNDL